MGFEYIDQMPTPDETKQAFPIPRSLVSIKQERDRQIKNILEGKDDRLLVIIGPCSADYEPAVLEYCDRLSKVAKQKNII